MDAVVRRDGCGVDVPFVGLPVLYEGPKRVFSSILKVANVRDGGRGDAQREEGHLVGPWTELTGTAVRSHIHRVSGVDGKVVESVARVAHRNGSGRVRGEARGADHHFPAALSLQGAPRNGGGSGIERLCPHRLRTGTFGHDIQRHIVKVNGFPVIRIPESDVGPVACIAGE